MQLEEKYRELKSVRKKEKEEWRKLLPEFIQEFNRVKVEFLKLEDKEKGNSKIALEMGVIEEKD